MRTQPFQFDYPVTDFGTNPASFIGDLLISAIAEVGGNEKLLSVKIRSVCFFDGSNIATNIQRILKAVAPVVYKEIEQAAHAHFQGLNQSVCSTEN